LWLTNSMTTSNCIYGPGSFAIHSLTFFLTSATGADFLVEIPSLTLKMERCEKRAHRVGNDRGGVKCGLRAGS
jgi:hypothetical protein